ncbi:hypothetical protein [Paractinoplanes atraurantiacus]|uniref:hypothetical protein n=1 Tax=Paractinoplanes atraurantiacus TaxID=1036182 RepID=UPI001C53DB2A|nr:hypothetical protein [Actinoplanes atraurantiacus]
MDDELLTPSMGCSLPALRKVWNAENRMHVVLPRLGRLKLHESARKLARRIEAGTAQIMSATVRREGGRWFVAFTVEIEREISAARPESVVGVDVGIKHLAVLSTGESTPAYGSAAPMPG